MTIQEIRKKHNISVTEIAEMFSMSYVSFANSTARKRYEDALCNFYERIMK